jgi:hypothetical protein
VSAAVGRMRNAKKKSAIAINDDDFLMNDPIDNEIRIHYERQNSYRVSNPSRSAASRSV